MFQGIVDQINEFVTSNFEANSNFTPLQKTNFSISDCVQYADLNFHIDQLEEGVSKVTF
jgi:hypothetical protein